MNQISNERSCKGRIIVSSLPNIFSSTGHNIFSLRKTTGMTESSKVLPEYLNLCMDFQPLSAKYFSIL